MFLFLFCFLSGLGLFILSLNLSTRSSAYFVMPLIFVGFTLMFFCAPKSGRLDFRRVGRMYTPTTTSLNFEKRANSLKPIPKKATATLTRKKAEVSFTKFESLPNQFKAILISSLFINMLILLYTIIYGR